MTPLLSSVITILIFGAVVAGVGFLVCLSQNKAAVNPYRSNVPPLPVPPMPGDAEEMRLKHFRELIAERDAFRHALEAIAYGEPDRDACHRIAKHVLGIKKS